MLNFLARCLLVASWIVALVLTALTVESRSSALPLTSDETIAVREWPGDRSTVDLRRGISAFAVTHNVVVGQIEPAVQDNRGARVIHITGPGADEIIARQPRVDFGDSMRTGFAAMTGIEHHSPVGDWLVLGRQEATPALADVLRSMGAEVESETLPRWPSPRRPEPSEMVTGLMLASVAAALVISRTRRHAISRLHGGSVLGAALKEVVPLGAVWFASGVLTLAAGGLWAVLTQEGVGLWEWLAHAGALGMIFLGFTASGALLTLGAVWSVELVRALKGELPARGIIVASWLMRAGAVVLALGALNQCLSLATASANRNQSLETMRAVPGAHLLLMGGAYSNEAQNAMGKVMGPWLQQQARAGRLLLADPVDGDSGSFLFINQRYLDANPIRLSDGRDARDVVDPQGVTVLIPENRWEERETILPEAREQAEFKAGDQRGFPMGSFTMPSGVELPLFGIPSEVAGGGSGEPETTRIQDAIVLVTPPELFTDHVSAASRGRALLFDADALVQQVEADPRLAGYVTSITPVETRAAHQAADALTQLRIAVFEAAVAFVIALVAGLSLAVSHGKLRGQRIFVRHLHGGNPLASYRLLLALEMVLALGVLVWIPWQILQLRSEHDAMLAMGGGLGAAPGLRAVDLLPGLLVVLVVSGGMCGTLCWVHQRIIKMGISEA